MNSTRKILLDFSHVRLTVSFEIRSKLFIALCAGNLCIVLLLLLILPFIIVKLPLHPRLHPLFLFN